MMKHLSELAIDRLRAGELPRDEEAAVWSHAGTCTRCGELVDDAVVTQRAFAVEGPPAWLPIPRRRSAVPYAVMTALAAAAVVVLWPATRSEPVATRAKGAAIVGFYVAHGDDVRRGNVREVVMPGDRVQLFTTTDEPLWFAAVGVDAKGTRTVYVEPRRVEGREHVLPLAIELDATLGDEVVTGIFCPSEFDAIVPPAADCTIDRFTLAKVPR